MVKIGDGIMANVYYLGEIGRVISQTAGVDFTGATAKQVKFVKPSGAILTKTTSKVFVDDAPSGQIHVLTESGDLSETGEWLMQAMVTIGSNVLYGSVDSFIVESTL